ncbi:DUF4405 domain-containing protein [Clostridium oceanicum]|uniref:Flavinylation-associated cytochrome domain-containing protein n=1 Tax=Clostridium oceanicum TaxID=1543 RepID=A0ABP3UQB8_9CLOT
MKTKKINLKLIITSLTIISFIICLITSIVLLIPNKIFSNYLIMGLNRRDWVHFHIISSYIFLFFAAIHFYEHFKSAIYGMKNKNLRGFINVILISTFMICSISGIACKYITPIKNPPNKNHELNNTLYNKESINTQYITLNKNKDINKKNPNFKRGLNRNKKAQPNKLYRSLSFTHKFSSILFILVAFIHTFINIKLYKTMMKNNKRKKNTNNSIDTNDPLNLLD